MRLAVPLAALLITASATSGASAEPVAPKSRQTAVWLSLGATFGGVGLAIAGGAEHEDAVVWIGGAGALLGPTAGHWYAGEIATPGLLARGLGAGLLLAGAPKLICWTAPCDDQQASWGLAIAGSALVLGGTVWDIYSAPRAVDDWNREHEMELTITPTALRSPRGDTVPGLALTGTF